ncbi:hypothetical protein KIN20_020111, partial [Parelaphostrongylus tenuis]
NMVLHQKMKTFGKPGRFVSPKLPIDTVADKLATAVDPNSPPQSKFHGKPQDQQLEISTDPMADIIAFCCTKPHLFKCFHV